MHHADRFFISQWRDLLADLKRQAAEILDRDGDATVAEFHVLTSDIGETEVGQQFVTTAGRFMHDWGFREPVHSGVRFLAVVGDGGAFLIPLSSVEVPF
jgi:hypothetical protein